MRIRREAASPEYANYALLLGGQRHFAQNAQQVVGMASISQPQIADFLLPLPPLAEQQRIVAKLEVLLGKVDACRKRLEKIPVILKRFRQSVLAAACSGRLTADWREVNPDSSPKDVTRIAQRPLPPVTEEDMLFEAPRTWGWCRLGSVAVLVNGDRGKNYPNKAEYVSNGIAFINAGHILPGGRLSSDHMHYITREKFDSLRGGKIQKGDILYCLRGSLGKTAIVDTDAEGAIASSLVIIRIIESLNRKFAFYLLTSSYGTDLVSRFDNGSAQPNLSGQNVGMYAIPLPPLGEQHEIARRGEALFVLADQIETRYAKAKTHVDRLTQSILAKAFRGDLVPQDPNDEPASELLERIRLQRQGAGVARSQPRRKGLTAAGKAGIR